MPSEHPILFAGRLVRALLAGRKTQTRRIVKLDGKGRCAKDCAGAEPERAHVNRGLEGPNCEYMSVPCKDGAEQRVYCPFGVPGDTLWVRETWQAPGAFAKMKTGRVFYRADHEDGRSECGQPWKPSIHMPRWASRITLRVEAVRVERLQAITGEDAKAEGIELGKPVKVRLTVKEPDGTVVRDGPAINHDFTYRGAFCRAWDSINGKRAPWSSNPHVWVITFSLVEVKARRAA